MQELIFLIQRGPLDNRKRQLIINPRFVQFENKDTIADSLTRFNREEIKECRYGINWIRGISDFIIGREYQVFLRSHEGTILKINFKSFYGIGKKRLHQQFIDIMDALWNFYLNRIAADFLKKFHNDEEFRIGDVHFAKDKITIKTTGIIKGQTRSIPWLDVSTKNYATYFSIFSASDPASTNRGYSYLNDWNTIILNSVVNAILTEMNSSSAN